MHQLPFRQIHLDFHTSEFIPTIGKDWDKGHFQRMLELGSVNSINIFAKCHHGWSYHPTTVPLGRMHPNLQFDLLGAMIDAAHEIGVKTPAYLSAGHDEKLANTHAHWLRRGTDGVPPWSGWLKPGYHEFCMRSPYLDYLIAQAEEVVRNYAIDGVWLDIVGLRDCACGYCIREILARGLDPRDQQARALVGRETYLNYARRITAAIHAIKPGLPVFHNGGHVSRGDREVAGLNTHLELESLPTGGYGYDHFPLSVRYVQGLGMEVIGMTGKFHTSWGEFGGFKHPNALRYEAALALANGAKMSVGDQMHPFAKLDPATYKLIGAAYAEVEQKEAWCGGVESVADVAILSVEAACGGAGTLGFNATPGSPDAGAVRVLLEGKMLFDVVDSESDFTRYKVLILPDSIPPEPVLVAKLQTYLAQGGKLMVTGDSLLDTEKKDFALDLGVKYLGEGTFNPIYLQPRFALADWENTAFVMYEHARLIKASTGEVLADRQDPFFNRDYPKFCSHQHTPGTGEIAGPLMVSTSNTVYLAFSAFRQYTEKGQIVLREVILHGLRQLLPAPTLETTLPAQGIQTVMHQREANRDIIHLLYASPVKRGMGIEVIEDLLQLSHITVVFRSEKIPTRVYLAPQQIDLPFTVGNGVMQTTVPEMVCHQMVVVEYE